MEQFLSTANLTTEEQLRERVKELNCLYAINELINEKDNLDEVLEGSLAIIVNAWLYPEVVGVRITLNEQLYQTENFHETPWQQSADITREHQLVGKVEVCYLQERPVRDEGPFLKEERTLINTIAKKLERFARRKKTENDLVEQKHFFEQVFMQSAISTQILDRDGWCERINPKLTQIFGVTSQHIEGRLYNIWKDEGVIQGGAIPHLEKVFHKKKTAEWETYFYIGLASDSQRIEVTEKKKAWYANWAYPIFNKNKEMSCVVIQHVDITERKQFEETQDFLIHCGYTVPGEFFFSSLAKYLSKTLDMEYICIDYLENDGLTAQTVAVYNNSKFDTNVTYALKDTPCGAVVEKGVCCFPADVCQLFPADTALQELKAMSYIGTTLFGFDKRPIGLIACIGQKPLLHPIRAESLLKLVSSRAAGEMERKKTEEALFESEKRYRELSILDDLTGIYNARYFVEQLKLETGRINRYGQALTMIMFDIDNFKAVNDSYGHVDGNKALSQLGQVIKRNLRKVDSSYRYGGEEFVILLPVTTVRQGLVIAEKIRQDLKRENISTSLGKDVYITVSMGIAQYRTQEKAEDFVKRTDRLMYRSKEKGRNEVSFEN